MADAYIVPPIDDSPEARDIFFQQVCELLNPSTKMVEEGGLPTETPTDVTGLTASGGFGSIVLNFSDVTYDGHSYTLFSRATDGVFSNAIPVGSTTTNRFVDSIPEPVIGTVYTYWAVNVSLRGEQSLNWSSPVSAVVSSDVGYSTDLLLGKLGYDEFKADSFPVRTEDVLPTLPDALYPESSVILLTTNGKLYRNVGGIWTTAVPLEDVTGAGALASLNDVTLAHVTDAGSLSALDTISATEIDNNAITSPKISAGAVIAGKIATNAVTTNTIATNAIVAGKIAAGALVVDDGVMQNGYIKTALMDIAQINSAQVITIDADKINAGTINVSLVLNAAHINGGTIDGSIITGGTLQTNTNPALNGGIKMSSNLMTVYDASGNARVRLGKLS